MLNYKKVETTETMAILSDLILVIWPEVFTPVIGATQVAYMLDTYQSIDQIKTKRRQNYLYLEKELEKINLKSRFEMDKIHCPGVYMFIIKGYDLPKLKVFMQEHGVESSVFMEKTAFLSL